MAIDPAALRAEILTGPLAAELSAPWQAGDDREVARLLNLARAGAAYAIKRPDIGSDEVLEAVARGEFNANNTADDRAHYESLTQQARLRLINEDGTDTRILSFLVGFFATGSGTRTRIRALGTRQGSRAEVLWGFGADVSDVDVAQARVVGL